MFAAVESGVLESRLEVVKFVSATLAVLSPLQNFATGGNLPNGLVIGVAVAGALLAFTAQVLQLLAGRRARNAERKQTALTLLARADLPEARALSPAEYGAHEPLPEYATLGYVPREADAVVEAAVQGSRFVLVAGSRLCGKTRTASEAIRRALPAARLVIPRSGEALIKLLDPKTRLPGLSASTAVLWLEDLGPYIEEGFDTAALDQLASASVPVIVVATISTPDEVRLRTAPPPEGNRARALLARANRIELAAELTVGEQRAFAELAGRPAASPAIGRLIARDAEFLAPSPPSPIAVPPGVPVPAAPPPAPSIPAAARIPPAVSAPVPQQARTTQPTEPAAWPVPQSLPPQRGRRPRGAPSWSAGWSAPGRPGRASARGGSGWLWIGLALGIASAGLPLAAVPAFICGLVALARRRIAGGLVVCAVALVGGLIGLLVYTANSWTQWPGTATQTQFVRDATDAAVLNDYFSRLQQACAAGFGAGRPCGNAFNAPAQNELLRQAGYDACRADGNPASVCVSGLP